MRKVLPLIVACMHVFVKIPVVTVISHVPLIGGHGRSSFFDGLHIGYEALF